jgi:hypothetical protein
MFLSALLATWFDKNAAMAFWCLKGLCATVTGSHSVIPLLFHSETILFWIPALPNVQAIGYIWYLQIGESFC